MADETLMTQADPVEADATEQDQTQGQGADGSGGANAAATEPKAAEAQPEAKPAEKPAGAPDKYEFKAAEGQTFAEPVIGAFSEVAKELNLPQDQAQKVLDKMVPVLAAHQLEQVQAVREEWAGASKADAEFGGDKLPESLGLAKKAMEQFATPALRTLLDDSGFGNHPEVIRMFFRVGKAVGDDGFVKGGAGVAKKSAAEILYSSKEE